AGQSACEGEEKSKAGEKYRLYAQSLARLGDVMCERIDTERHRGYQPTDKATSWTVMAAEQDVERGNKHEPKEDSCGDRKDEGGHGSFPRLRLAPAQQRPGGQSGKCND